MTDFMQGPLSVGSFEGDYLVFQYAGGSWALIHYEEGRSFDDDVSEFQFEQELARSWSSDGRFAVRVYKVMAVSEFTQVG